MTPQKAIQELKFLKEKLYNGIFKDKIGAFDVAISALEKQIEIEKAQFTHICKSDKNLYPTTFSIYARLIEENEESVTIDRYQKFGALPIGKITISKADFERYYKRVMTNDTI